MPRKKLKSNVEHCLLIASAASDVDLMPEMIVPKACESAGQQSQA